MTHTGASRSRPLVVVAVPTWREAAPVRLQQYHLNIANHRGLRDRDVLLVHVDSETIGDTAEVLVSSPVNTKTETVSLPPGLLRNERAQYCLFCVAHALGAEVAISCDEGLEAVAPDWLSSLTDVVEEGADAVLPIYSRQWDDATFIDQVVAPLVVAVTNLPLRQPLASVSAFSQHAVAAFLSDPWPQAGWEVSVALESSRRELSIEQILLSSEPVSISRSDDGPSMLQADGRSLLDERCERLFRALTAWNSVIDPPVALLPNSPSVRPPPNAWSNLRKTSALAVGRESSNPILLRLLGRHVLPASDPKLQGNLDLRNAARWGLVLYRVLQHVRRHHLDAEFISGFEALFLARVSSVFSDLLRMSERDVADMIMTIASTIRSARVFEAQY